MGVSLSSRKGVTRVERSLREGTCVQKFRKKSSTSRKFDLPEAFAPNTAANRSSLVPSGIFTMRLMGSSFEGSKLKTASSLKERKFWNLISCIISCPLFPAAKIHFLFDIGK